MNAFDNIYDRDNFQYLKPAIVKSVKDEFGMGRIKVKILGTTSVGGDNKIENNEEYPYAFPLIPKHLSVIPQVDEVVWVLVLNRDKQHVDRFYFGPVISQLHRLEKDSFDDKVQIPYRPFSFATSTPDKSVIYDSLISNNKLEDLRGVFPKSEEISIQGRYNTDITQKRNEIVIRAGKFEAATTNEFKIKFNANTQGFIQIRNDVSYPNIKNPNVTDKGSVTNIVSNKINLLTHKDGIPRVTLNNDNLISDDEIRKMLNEAHQLPFGDILLEYLILLKNAIFSHVHNGNGNPATDLTTSGNVQAISTLRTKAQDLESRMLSKNVRIN